MNKQNSHILEKIKEVEVATRSLVNAGLTVVQVSIEGARPCIDLLSAPRIDQRMPISTKTTRRVSAGVETIVTAHIDGCEIRWQERS